MITIEAKTVKKIIDATFPDYKKRKVYVSASESVRLYGLNWDGGSRSQYRACTINGETNGKHIDMSRQAPWNNQYEGLEINIPPDCVIVSGGVFCGKTATLHLHVHPSNMLKFITA